MPIHTGEWAHFGTELAAIAFVVLAAMPNGAAPEMRYSERTIGSMNGFALRFHP